MALAPLLGLILVIILTIIAVVLLPFVLYKLIKGVAWFIRHIFTFIGGMLGDSLRFVGSIITGLIFLPLMVMNVVINRWSAAKHFWRGFQSEFVNAGHALYRVAIGHPARFLLLTPLTEGFERRIPQAIAQAPTRDTPTKRTGVFEGYNITGSLKGGGSGGKLYIATPDARKLAGFDRRGETGVDKVVIKSFSLNDGSSLPQIIRESRALEAARDMGLVLDHELTADRFYYAMRYVPGADLTTVTEQLHGAAGPDGLDRNALVRGLGYIADLLDTLDRYHAAGLWHKDIKPDNIIVGKDNRAHLVDLGLVTPLRSAMTLTTHGTEYFRDPELVRLALRGVKVHEVDGVKFDIYGAGACLFAVVEQSFPAHGALSQVKKRCPEALRWIIRRAMAEMHQRYGSAREMLLDLQALRNSPDPFAMKPADLPSMRGGSVRVDEAPAQQEFKAPTPPPAPGAPEAAAFAAAGSPVPPPGKQRKQPKLRMANWWTGRYETADPPQRPAPEHRIKPVAMRASAADQIAAARARSASVRERACKRAAGRRRGRKGGVLAKTDRELAKISGPPSAFWPLVVVVVIGVVAFLKINPDWHTEAGSVNPPLVVSTGFTSYAGITDATETGVLKILPEEYRYEGSENAVQTLKISMERTSNGTTQYLPIESEEFAEMIDDLLDEPLLVVAAPGLLDGDAGSARWLVDQLEAGGVDFVSAEEIETLAQALAIVGDSLPGNTATTAAIRAWLTGDASDVTGGVLWIGARESSSPQSNSWQFIFPADDAVQELETMLTEAPAFDPNDSRYSINVDFEQFENMDWTNIERIIDDAVEVNILNAPAPE